MTKLTPSNISEKRTVELEANNRSTEDKLARILMLVPHEPEADPRIKWVKQLCLEIGPTDVIGALSLNEQSALRDKPCREYDGRVYVERINIFEFASIGAKWLFLMASVFHVGGTIRRYIKRESITGNSHPDDPGTSIELENSLEPRLRKRNPFSTVLITADHQIGAVCRFLSNLASYGLIVSALYRRGRAASISPRVIICHDIFALAAGAMLKKVFRCSIIYDSHEFWPEADLIAQEWEKRLTMSIEGRLLRHADVVVTVSPPLARHLERLYSLPHVVSAPNAEPVGDLASQPRKTISYKPVKFLLQGRVSPRRGIEELFEAWSLIQDLDAVFYVRCPQNEYLFELQSKFHRMINAGSIVILPAVKEEELVEAATFADVGVIPYRKMSLIHKFCCPNKLSQYMQAGLAVLSNNLDFVSDVITRYKCGMVYDATKPQSFVEAVSHFVRDSDGLKEMKQNAFEASQSEFHWEVQSVEYRDAIRRLYFQKEDAASSDGVGLARRYA
ncbi:MAG: glycosyltransferase family 4 protein [Nitrospiraceae bacterium]